MTTATRDGARLAALWRLLSLGFAPPTEDTLAEVEALADVLSEAEPIPELHRVLEAVRGVWPADASAQYAWLFRGTVRVAPYEGSYEIDPIQQGRQMADVAAFYRAFGAQAHGPVAERPDFVGCELEFLAFLELRRLGAAQSDEDESHVRLLDDIGDSFLRDHAGRWLPAFLADVLAAAADAPLYRELAALGLRVVRDELARRGIESSLPKRPARLSVEADTFECGSAAQFATAPDS